MKSFFSVLAAMIVMGLAYWAYQENYRTQEALKEVRKLQREIAENRVTLGVLKAEWAYLNRPDRLRELVMLNYEKLQLLPLEPTQFGQVDQVAFPVDTGPITNPIELSAETDQ